MNLIYKRVFGKKLEKLYKLRNSAGDKNVQELNDTIKLLEEFIYDEETEKHNEESLAEFLTLESYIAKNYYNYFQILGDFVKIPNIDLKERKYRFPKLTDDELLAINHDFFKNYFNDYFYKFFLKDFNRRKELLHIIRRNKSDVQPETIHLGYLDENHIILPIYGQLNDILSLAHEYGHVLQLKINYHIKLFTENSIFSEIISIFCELLIYDYLKSLSDFEEVSKIDNQIFFKYKYDDVSFCYELYKLFMYWDLLNKNNVENALEQYKKKFNSKYNILLMDDAQDLIGEKNVESLEYSLGYILAIELFVLYKNDAELGLYKLKNLININCAKNKDKYFKEILALGINPNESVEQYKDYVMRPL